MQKPLIELSATDAASLLEDKTDETLLLDVREHVELEQAAIAGALHIPMNEIPERIGEVDREKTVVCMCHVGGRSAQVAGYLMSQGFEKVYNLAGGIDAWARDVDAGVIRQQ